MTEFEIYLPATHNDGTPVEAEKVARAKETLAATFGGYTHFTQRSEGAWSMGGVTFRDEITIVRVLDDGSANFDFHAFRRSLEESFRQERILIVRRAVEVV